MFKRLICSAGALLILFAFSVNAAAVNIDGNAGNKEWENSEVYNLEDQRDLVNDVKNAVVNIAFDSDSNALYILLRCEIKSLSDLSAAKLAFGVNGSDNTEINFNNELLCSPYETHSAVKADEDSGMVFLEAVCYIKEGLDLPAEICLSIYDSSSNGSNVYNLSYGEEPAEEDNDSGADSGAKVSKTAKQKSSKTNKASARKTKRSATAFPFNRATKNNEQLQNAEAEEDAQADESAAYDKRENLNTEISGTSSKGRTVLIITGSVCALAVAAAAVYSAIKSNKNNQD